MSRVKGTALPEIITEQNWSRRPKVMQFVRALRPHTDTPQHFVRFHAYCLWESASQGAIDGHLGEPDNDTLAEWCEWGGDSAVLADALRTSGLIEQREGCEGWWLHDWEAQTGRLYVNRLKERQRKKRARDDNQKRQSEWRERQRRKRSGETSDKRLKGARKTRNARETLRERYASVTPRYTPVTSQIVTPGNDELPSDNNGLECPVGIPPVSVTTSTSTSRSKTTTADPVTPRDNPPVDLANDPDDRPLSLSDVESIFSQPQLGTAAVLPRVGGGNAPLGGMAQLRLPIALAELRDAMAAEANTPGSRGNRASYIAGIISKRREAASHGPRNGHGRQEMPQEPRSNSGAYADDREVQKSQHEREKDALRALADERQESYPTDETISAMNELGDILDVVAELRRVKPRNMSGYLQSKLKLVRESTAQQLAQLRGKLGLEMAH